MHINMVFGDNLYSRVIAGLKIVLPLAALALLSTVFLLSRPSDLGQDITFADPGISARASQQQVSRPVFSSTTGKGDVITLRAQLAKPDPDVSGQALAETINAELGLTDGSRVVLSADRAVVNDADNQIVLQGGVRIATSTGYDVTTSALTGALDEIAVETLAPVQGNGPAGRFTAGRMVLQTDTATGDAQILFTEGVKLVYDPAQ